MDLLFLNCSETVWWELFTGILKQQDVFPDDVLLY